ncbi:MAG: FAD-binding protein [Desulfobacteraceae bacterium]|jgi:2,4-dienoyl-CoA reductase-like NADH-dependent reductase (Old Yellow Enzyme family)/thioredoxin reductase|nr:MAG: FAD-binding protein [Desulfobacteraceae bacterium]
MNHLFTPFQIKTCRLENRIVMPGLASFLLEGDGSIPDKAVEHYRMRAAGGPGMVVMEACSVSPEGIVSANQARIYDDGFLPSLERISKAIKSEGSVAGIQLHHGGRQTSSKVIKRLPVAPSPLPCPTISGPVEELTLEGIQNLVRKFGEAAERAVAAGFQFIEIHGAHGYLINQFLSRFSNIRRDQYGGDIEGRTRFAREIVTEIRKRIGDNLPLSFKISAQEFVPDGLTVEESIPVIKILIDAGIDIVQVSAGNDATPEWICQPMFMEKACLVGSAHKIRQAVKVPVMAVGRINDPVIADAIIGEGKADLVCMGRGLLADPELPRKARQGRVEDIRMCIACNTCMESIFRKGRIECLVNPFLGREKEMVLRPVERPKRIMVIGGGPGGLNAAWMASRRGHKVLLYEKNQVLGGQLLLGSVTGFKRELLHLIAFQRKQVEKSGVECHVDSEVTVDTIKAISPDAVILATGSVPAMPDVKGINNPMVMTIPEVLNGDIPKIKKTLVVGGGPTGCEVALHLSELGSPVTIVEMMSKVASGLETMTRKLLLRRIKESGVNLMTGCALTRIDDYGVYVTSMEGADVRLDAERVVIATGNRPQSELYQQIISLGIEVYKIGDCLEPRSAKAAIYEGTKIGCSI